MLRKLSFIIALAMAGPAMAGTWNGPSNTGIQHFPIGNSTDQMLAHFGYESATGRPTFQIGVGPQSSTHFDARTFTVRNGPTLGGAYRQATTVDVDDISVRWQSFTDGNLVDFPRTELGTLRLANDPTQALTRTVIEAGNPPPNPAKGYHESGWWWDPAFSGIGFGLNIRGDTAFIGIFHSREDGLDDWSITTGAMTSASLYEGRLQHCDKATGAVICTDQGAITLAFSYLNNDSRHPRIGVTLPNGATMTLQPYSR